MSAPTYEEVQAFAQSEGLDSKTNIGKFYDFYSRSHFEYKGEPMDWKKKLREWASSELPRKSQMQPACIKRVYEKPTKEYWDKLEKEMEGWGK